jgi:hypothetical protein
MPGDIMRIYEINPLVIEIARTQFTYLQDTAAQTEIVLGDGRLILPTSPTVYAMVPYSAGQRTIDTASS